jgi:hypothetical protein
MRNLEPNAPYVSQKSSPWPIWRQDTGAAWQAAYRHSSASAPKADECRRFTHGLMCLGLPVVRSHEATGRRLVKPALLWLGTAGMLLGLDWKGPAVGQVPLTHQSDAQRPSRCS